MNTTKLKNLVEENKNIDPNDDFAQERIWNEMCEILNKNLDDTILYLNQASKDEIYYVSSIFEDLSFHFKSLELIECMKRNAVRTGVNCDVDIEYAIKALNYK